MVGRQPQAGTRAGNHHRHTHRRETSAPQRRPKTTHKLQTAQHAYTSYKQQSAYQGAAHALDQDTTHASLHSMVFCAFAIVLLHLVSCTRHQGGPNRQAKRVPDRGHSRNLPRVYREFCCMRCHSLCAICCTHYSDSNTYFSSLMLTHCILPASHISPAQASQPARTLLVHSKKFIAT